MVTEVGLLPKLVPLKMGNPTGLRAPLLPMLNVEIVPSPVPVFVT